ncbi:MAG: putative metal-binding motif-containing protein, partial [Crocinitomicaceae bacterium]
MRTTKSIHIFAVGLCLSIGGFSIAQDADMDGFPVPIDCNDNDASINPAAPEILGDGIDNNCDGIIDSITTIVWTGGGNGTGVDADGDGFPDFIDCDDNNAAINPGMPEIMGDGIDNNCDGLIDSVYTGNGGNGAWIDADGDGWFDFEDCDDNDPNVNPAMPEILGDGIDNNCDGLIDSTYTGNGGGPTGYVDADGDGFPDFIDCDDNDPNVNPAMPEIMGDGIDNNCDGFIDSVYNGGPGFVDADGDGWFDFQDCDDNDPNVNPGMPEIMGDGIDNNCDGLIDSTWTGGGNTTWVDADGDGYPDFIDCNDNDSTINPGAIEIMGDGIDNDCDGLVDMPSQWGGNTPILLADADGDGYPAIIDCDDNDPNVNPGMPEIPGDGIDNNCNGVIDLNISIGNTPTPNASSDHLVKVSNELISSVGPNPVSSMLKVTLQPETEANAQILDM